MTTDLKPILRATHKDFHPLLRTIVEMGGSVKVTNGNHLQVRVGRHVTHTALTPRDPRNDMKNMKRIIQLHRADGLDTKQKGC